MKIKTSEAKGLQLDWGLVVAHGAKHTHIDAEGVYADDACFPVHRDVFGRIKHTDPAVCMENIASYKIDVRHQFYSSPELSVLACWGDEGEGGYAYAHGSTVAEAVARCVISMRLGDEFECPDELGVQL